MLDIQQSILDGARKVSFSGYDPFDGLNSHLFDLMPSQRKSLLGLIWIQLFKRSPVNFRLFFGVPKRRNPKGIGLFISGLLNDYVRTGDNQYLHEACELGEWLLTQQCDKAVWQYPCWGYHFDWKARAFYVPKGKPNVITTIYVSRALYELGKATGDLKFCDVALASANFIVDDLYCKTDGREFFGYIPGEAAFVHNASLWAAAWVAFAASKTNNQQHAEIATRVAWQSVNEQAIDGSWVYGTRHHHQFIDGFHTGYNLEALHEIRSALATTEFDIAIEKGLRYYRNNFFEADGTAKYYNSNRYPLDMHSVAQAIITFLKVSGTTEDISLSRRVIDWSINELYLPKKKRFVYQKTSRVTNKINYVRWTQAWVYYSFSYFNRYIEESHA